MIPTRDPADRARAIPADKVRRVRDRKRPTLRQTLCDRFVVTALSRLPAPHRVLSVNLPAVMSTAGEREIVA